LIKINNNTCVQHVVNRFFLSSVLHNIRHSQAPGNENCHSRIPGNKNTRPGMETLCVTPQLYVHCKCWHCPISSDNEAAKQYTSIHADKEFWGGRQLATHITHVIIRRTQQMSVHIRIPWQTISTHADAQAQ